MIIILLSTYSNGFLDLDLKFGSCDDLKNVEYIKCIIYAYISILVHFY